MGSRQCEAAGTIGSVCVMVWAAVRSCRLDTVNPRYSAMGSLWTEIPSSTELRSTATLHKLPRIAVNEEWPYIAVWR